MTRDLATNEAAQFTERVRANQQKLTGNLQPQYDFIVCGSGTSGSVVAGRLAENADVQVLLLEAGGRDDIATITEAAMWPANLGSERDWDFHAAPNRCLNGRTLSLSMGKVLGGGSSINAMIWARGHKTDWDFFADEVGDPAWNYESILKIYRRIENWRGKPDPAYRGSGGPVLVAPCAAPSPIALAVIDAAQSIGIAPFENQNGRLMESDGGASITDLRVWAGKRQSVFRSYTFPRMAQANLTVLTNALVTRLTFEGRRVSGVEFSYQGGTHRILAGREVILSLGAMHTPKLLMQSGLGDQEELRRFEIPVVQHLPGVGRNFQDHVGFDCVWESQTRSLSAPAVQATFFLKTNPKLDRPNLQTFEGDFAKSSPENTAKFALPENGWGLFGTIVSPKSRGRIRLTGRNPLDPIQIEANSLSHPDDLAAARMSVDLSREIGNSAILRPFTKREVAPGNIKGADLDNFIRDATVTSWHETCTAKMGRGAQAVVNGALKVYGVDKLRIADGSVLPRITTGNTMAPCVIIGERAAEMLRAEHKL